MLSEEILDTMVVQGKESLQKSIYTGLFFLQIKWSSTDIALPPPAETGNFIGSFLA